MTRPYDWSRFRRYIEPGAVVGAVDPDDEPTVRIPRERMVQTLDRPLRSPEELDLELLQHAEAGQ